jgi:hypothetical protein
MVLPDNFEMSTPALSRLCSSSELRKHKLGGEYRIRTYGPLDMIFGLANRRNKPLCQFTILNYTGMLQAFLQSETSHGVVRR